MFRAHREQEPLTPEQLEREWNDPLTVKVGLYVGADDLPADGWPDHFDREVVTRILSYLPTDEEIDGRVV